MAVKDSNMQKTANTAKKAVRLFLGTSAISQTAKIPDAIIPGYAFQVVKVEVFALTVTAALTVDVLIGATSVLTAPITPVAAAVTAGTLATALASIRGGATEQLNLAYTTNGSGAGTNVAVTVWIRPLPLNGETYSI